MFDAGAGPVTGRLGFGLVRSWALGLRVRCCTVRGCGGRRGRLGRGAERGCRASLLLLTPVLVVGGALAGVGFAGASPFVAGAGVNARLASRWLTGIATHSHVREHTVAKGPSLTLGSERCLGDEQLVGGGFELVGGVESSGSVTASHPDPSEGGSWHMVVANPYLLGEPGKVVVDAMCALAQFGGGSPVTGFQPMEDINRGSVRPGELLSGSVSCPPGASFMSSGGFAVEHSADVYVVNSSPSSQRDWYVSFWDGKNGMAGKGWLYVRCFKLLRQRGRPPLRSLAVRMRVTPEVAIAHDNVGEVTVDCRELGGKDLLLGGGYGLVYSDANAAPHIVASFPSPVSQKWIVEAVNPPENPVTYLRAYAICLVPE